MYYTEGKGPEQNRKKVIVIGHTNPDTDSICSAIAYAQLKKETEGPWFQAYRNGELNLETNYVLKRFGVDVPPLCHDVYAEVQDIDIRPVEGVPPETSLRKAWELMRDMEADTQPIVAEDGTLMGICTLGDLAMANMDSLDPYALSEDSTPYKNIIAALNASVVCGDPEGCCKKGKIVVGVAGPELRESQIENGDIVLVGNRYEAQLCAIEMGASLIVVCNGAEVARIIHKLAEENGCMMISTPYDPFAATVLIQQAVPISAHMTPFDKLLKFLPTEPLEDVEETMKSVRHRYFPICSTRGKYLGLISRRNLLNLKRKQLILVDHNEKSQCVDGWEEAEILEIIDHHRIGNLQTAGPIRFTNRPVGCTATIIWQFYQNKGVTPTPQIAGLLLAAILSDTLAFRSPTCTLADEDAAEALSSIAGVSAEELAAEMFAAGEDLTGRSAKDVFFADFKRFTQSDKSFGVGQASYMSRENLEHAKSLLQDYIQEAREKSGLDMIFFMLTDIQDTSSVLLYDGEDAEALVKEAFGGDRERVGEKPVIPEKSEHVVSLPGVISRKKQLIPALVNTLRRM